MPKCNACSRDVNPGALSESFQCPNCQNQKIWRCEECKGSSKKYSCPTCGYKGR